MGGIVLLNPGGRRWTPLGFAGHDVVAREGVKGGGPRSGWNLRHNRPDQKSLPLGWRIQVVNATAVVMNSLSFSAGVA